MRITCFCNGSRGTDCDYCGGTGYRDVNDPRYDVKNYGKIQILVAKRVREKIMEYFQSPNQAYKLAAIRLNDRLASIANETMSFGKIGMPNTNHGETRIENCVKYHIGFQANEGNQTFRVVTVELHQSNIIAIIYFGDHDETELWINKNKGYKLIAKTIGGGVYFEEVLKSGEIQRLELDRAPISGKLFKFIEQYWINKIKAKLNSDDILLWEDFDSNVTDRELSLARRILSSTDEEFKNMMWDLFVILRSGEELNKAINRLKLYFKDGLEIKEVDEDTIINKIVRRNDSFINLRKLSTDELSQFRNLDYDDVIVYLHPDQEKFAKERYKGSVRISGVSGSGKTSILINRAVNLAIRYIEDPKPILVLTLHTSLTELLKRGIGRIIETKYSLNTDLKEKIVAKIQVKSLWSLFSELILERSNILNNEEKFVTTNRLEEKVNKNPDENIEHIWDAFYKYPFIEYPVHANNENLYRIHQYILDKGINPSKYIKDEFDLIRSYLEEDEFIEYLDNERKNRLLKIDKGNQDEIDGLNRYAILEGLKNWRYFMQFNGISDYAELSIILSSLIKKSPHINKINASYRCILIDESQDFGTNEIKIIRKLVENGGDDLFIVGDFAQKIHIKNMNFKTAGVHINEHFKMYHNYRNSAEILIAADKVLKLNWKNNQQNQINDDLLIDDLEFSNLHSGNINIIKSNSLFEEFHNAISFIHNDSGANGKNTKYCIVVCGYSKFEIQSLVENNPLLSNFVVLNTVINFNNDNNKGINFIDSRYFISDLEHCKGFEFDTVIILNANNNVIPKKINSTLEESDTSNNEISKFYVAMTRAKSNLIISYSYELSEFLNLPQREKYFNDSKWDLKNIDSVTFFNLNKRSMFKNIIWKQTGKEFIFSDYAIGLSTECQDKLKEIVTGRRADIKRNRLTITEEFQDIRSFYNYISTKNNIITFQLLKSRKILNELLTVFSTIEKE